MKIYWLISTAHVQQTTLGRDASSKYHPANLTIRALTMAVVFYSRKPTTTLVSVLQGLQAYTARISQQWDSVAPHL